MERNVKEMPVDFVKKVKALSSRIFQNHLQDLGADFSRTPDNITSLLRFVQLSDKRIIEVIATVCIQVRELTASFEKMQKSIDQMNKHLEAISRSEAVDEGNTVDFEGWKERINGATPK